MYIYIFVYAVLYEHWAGITQEYCVCIIQNILYGPYCPLWTRAVIYMYIYIYIL